MNSKTTTREFCTVEDIKAYYLENISRYGIEAPRTMGYRVGPIDDRLIGNMLPREVPSSYSLLDVGCGLGQIVTILREKFPQCELSRMVGIDIVDEFVLRCRSQFPRYEFLTGDFLEWSSLEKFDLVIAAGVLVTRVDNFEEYLAAFIAKMVAASKGWIGFNVIGSYGQSYTAKHLGTVSEKKLSSILNEFSQVAWEVAAKEVFAGALDTFVRGRVLSR